MYRNMVTSLMVHGRIQTTESKAKELRKIADKVITMGKRVPPSTLDGLKGEALAAAKAKRLHNIRRARNYVHDKDALHRVFNEYAERFKDRPGGYTRILKSGYRPGDNAPMAFIELVEAYTPSEDAPAAPEEVKAAVKEEAVEVAEEAAEEEVAEEPADEEVAEEPADEDAEK
jgi:large subunit ribosomal protein L17